VMQNASCMGNCRLLKEKGRVESARVRSILEEVYDQSEYQ